MMPMNQKVANLWVARIIPAVLVGIVGYGTWVVIVLVCVDYLLKPAPTVGKPRRGAGIAILTIYACLLLLLALTYFRLVYTVLTNPGYTPRGPQWHAEKSRKRSRSRSSRANYDVEKQNGTPEEQGQWIGGTSAPPYSNAPSAYGPANDVPAPGLQDFYKRDVFTCESDGRPIWCSTCLNWKLDRAHHCREIQRCVRKMDHFCPWVGGVVSETSQKFFVQFVVYGAIYSLFTLIFMAKFVAERARVGISTSEVHWIVVLALAAFFGLFLVGMSASSLQFVLLNTTTIENLSRKTKVWQLAVHMPYPPTPSANRPLFRTITYSQPLPGAPTAGDPASTGQPSEPRTFAILHSKPGENPWDLGSYRNFKSVMGDRWYDWVTPIKRSPCAKHESMDCEFETGPVVERMKREAGIISPAQIESEEEKHRRHRRRRRRRSTRARSGDDLESSVEGGKAKRHHRRHRHWRRSEPGTDSGDRG